MRKSFFFCVSLLIIAMSICACNIPSSNNEPQKPKAIKLIVDNNELYVDVGGTTSVNVSVEPIDAEVNYSLQYKNNKIIAPSFDNTFKQEKLYISGVNEGIATLTLHQDNLSASIEVVVGDYDSWFEATPEGSVSMSEKFPYATVETLIIKNLIDEKEIKKIAKNGFYSLGGETLLTNNLVIDEGIEEIGRYAFSTMILLKSVSLPESLKIIGPSAFSSTWSLENIVFPDGVTVISEQVLRSSGIKEFTVKETVTTIEEKAFSGCDNLVKLIIPSSVQTIGKNAFSGCRKAEIYIDVEKDTISGYPWGHPYPSSMIHWDSSYDKSN